MRPRLAGDEGVPRRRLRPHERSPEPLPLVAELARLLGRYGVEVELLDCSEEEIVAAAQRRAAA